MLPANLTAELLERSADPSIGTIVPFVRAHLIEAVALGLCAFGSAGWTLIMPLLSFLVTGNPTPTPTPPTPF